MNKELTQKELIDLLVKKLRLEYGSFEMKIHNGKCTNYSITKRVNYSEIDTNELVETKILKDY
jgi:hypothetical protein